MSKLHCYRATIMKITEVEVEIWADSYENAIEQFHYEDEDKFKKIETIHHNDRIVDIFPYDEDHQC